MVFENLDAEQSEGANHDALAKSLGVGNPMLPKHCLWSTLPKTMIVMHDVPAVTSVLVVCAWTVVDPNSAESPLVIGFADDRQGQ